MTRERADFVMKVVTGAATTILTVGMLGLFSMVRANDQQFATISEKFNQTNARMDHFEKQMDDFKRQNTLQWEKVDGYRDELDKYLIEIAVVKDRLGR